MSCITKRNGIHEILQHYLDYIKNEYHYDVVFIGLYGSQNYGLDNEHSDVDAKALVCPTFDDLIHNRKISHKITFDTGICTVCDVRDYFNAVGKGSVSDLEVLFSKWYITTDKFATWISGKKTSVLDDRVKNRIVDNCRVNLLRSLYGMMLTHRDRMFRPKPSVKDVVEKYGYNGKAASHVLRCAYLYKYFESGSCYSKHPFMIPDEAGRGMMLKLKNQEVGVDDAKKWVDAAISDIEHLKESDITSEFDDCDTMLISDIGYGIVRDNIRRR